MNRHFHLSFVFALASISYQDGRVVKALDLSSNGRVVRVGSNPTPGKAHFFLITLCVKKKTSLLKFPSTAHPFCAFRAEKRKQEKLETFSAFVSFPVSSSILTSLMERWCIAFALIQFFSE